MIYCALREDQWMCRIFQSLPALCRTMVSVDAIISNGVINLATDKAAVFREAARLLKNGGRLAISDIVTEVQLPDTIVCNATLWAACIGGAAQQDNYRSQIAAGGLEVVKIRDVPMPVLADDEVLIEAVATTVSSGGPSRP